MKKLRFNWLTLGVIFGIIILLGTIIGNYTGNYIVSGLGFIVATLTIVVVLLFKVRR